MPRFSGPQKKTAMRDLKQQRREEAEKRNAKTPPERTKKHRLANPSNG